MFRLVSMEPSSGWVLKKVFYTIDNVLLITRSRITFSKIHYGLTLVGLQLDAQNSCLFTYNTFILILINVLYVNKQEFCASSWRSTKVILWYTVNQSSRLWIKLKVIQYTRGIYVFIPCYSPLNTPGMSHLTMSLTPHTIKTCLWPTVHIELQTVQQIYVNIFNVMSDTWYCKTAD
jgi:hypothetical protein